MVVWCSSSNSGAQNATPRERKVANGYSGGLRPCSLHAVHNSNSEKQPHNLPLELKLFSSAHHPPLRRHTLSFTHLSKCTCYLVMESVLSTMICRLKGQNSGVRTTCVPILVLFLAFWATLDYLLTLSVPQRSYLLRQDISKYLLHGIGNIKWGHLR